MKRIFTVLAAASLLLPVSAQRQTDKLDRGLIAVPVSTGTTLVSWRILADEYYDVEYNVYRDGTKLNDAPLKVSNFTDRSGSASSSYTVRPVVRGVEKEASAPATVWNKQYFEIHPQHSSQLKCTYVPNDACCCDVDGDGQLEILMKYDNADEIGQSFPRNGAKINGVDTKEHTLLECLKLDGTVLWWVNCGPNMGDFQNNEINIVGYDWDGDGKAEAVMRAADGTTIHKADGSVYTVGNASVNYRAEFGGGANWFMHDGAEYLVYMNGETGAPYQCITYPLARLESGENDLNAAWGDGYGHRSSKYFFGAPYLDGRKPSIFLARGIYTRHKMIAYDVDPATHQLNVRWRWYNNTNGPWKGQGYHNYGIADVDMDGRDEIVFGSMIIDDNGKGLSTSGLGHGDAQHCGDFNPYIHGLEFFACNEDRQGFNYRDATTSKLYAASLGVGKDVGRSMCGNFTNDFPGAVGSAWGDPISTVTNAPVEGLIGTGINTNFRIFWDGDLLSETFNYLNGKNTEGCVAKYGNWAPIYTCEGSMTNNDTKGTPCYQGDVFGDWREEIIMRTAANNIRIYTTPNPTTYRNYSLWYDHQYRNAMVWQMCGYNQPPHVSYFLGELEGYTVAPPPLTMTGRVEVADGGTISSVHDGQHVIVCPSADASVSLQDGAKPYVVTFNVPSWVQGSAASECNTANKAITYDYYTCNVTGGAFSGDTRLVKQGDGTLNLPATVMTHTGATEIWGGEVNFDGSMSSSDVTLHRFARLNSDGGTFRSITAEYGSVIRPGGEGKVGNITVVEGLKLGYGSRLHIDINGQTCDRITAKSLTIVSKKDDVWKVAGPEFIQPVVELNVPEDLQPGEYVIGEFETTSGSVSDIKVVSNSQAKITITAYHGQMVVTVADTRAPSTIFWTGAMGSDWDFAATANFYLADDADQKAETFVNGDYVIFGDGAENRAINIVEPLSVDTMRFEGEGNYTLKGEGMVTDGALVKEGNGKVSISTLNSYTGGNYLRGGTVLVSSLANNIDATGNLGGVTTTPAQFTIENGAVLQTTAAVTNGSPFRCVGTEGGVLMTGGDFTQQANIYGTVLTKKGSGALKTAKSNSISRIIVASGSLAAQGGNPASVVELQGGTLYDDAAATSHEIYVPEGKNATWALTYSNYTAYGNKLTGKGTLTITPRNTVSRVRITGDWTNFEGTIKHTNTGVWLPLDNSTGMPKATLNVAAGCTVTNVAKIFTIGKLTGAGALAQPIANFQNSSAVSGSNTWKVGNSSEALGNFQFDGVIADAGGDNKSNFEKIGTCLMTVSGSWTNSGSVKVQEGVMKLTGNASLGTGALTIAAGAKLWGNHNASASLSNASVTVNGMLQPAQLETLAGGTLHFGKKGLRISSTGTLRLGVKKVGSTFTCSTIDNVSTLSLQGTISIFVSSAYEPQIGDEWQFFTNCNSIIGTPTITVDGYDIEFDRSRLSEGILIVSSVTGIGQVAESEPAVSSAVYNLSGRRMPDDAPLPAGVYIRGGHKFIVR
ncbi:MAG: hypothetical protein KBT20_01795 [Bacteroidales bacterium]|nr:hypothetical protein [Candidatus Liminaster caballi]